MYDRVAQRLIDGLARELEKKYEIERLKSLGAIKFVETTESKQAKNG